DCLDIYDEITIDPRPEQLDGPVDVPVEEWLCEPDATRECTTPIPPCCLFAIEYCMDGEYWWCHCERWDVECMDGLDDAPEDAPTEDDEDPADVPLEDEAD
ncbi:MAG: hypothetical protein JRG91_20000, partial [Deltaproteobacteria bacterium]|nr:hypothetical protein [Deltaproteobacteria bacterium]